jgi:hypothetical protein
VRKTIATTKYVPYLDTFTQAHLEQLGDFITLPIHEGFDQEVLLGYASFPRISKDRLSCVVKLLDGICAKGLTFSIGYKLEENDIVVPKVIGTVVQEDFHD